ncbi:unnamed protein product [Cylicocyclus nassatus]|uniref:Uncharacterized protein n=1 Tax=Cylicocyclus nassatus TaxID=53992 RepID=A0AA36DUT2_CYLNA|nr:unnamed protein product [Cylicocyclus nassatus]
MKLFLIMAFVSFLTTTCFQHYFYLCKGLLINFERPLSDLTSTGESLYSKMMLECRANDSSRCLPIFCDTFVPTVIVDKQFREYLNVTDSQERIHGMVRYCSDFHEKMDDDELQTKAKRLLYGSRAEVRHQSATSRTRAPIAYLASALLITINL